MRKFLCSFISSRYGRFFLLAESEIPVLEESPIEKMGLGESAFTLVPKHPLVLA